MSTQIKPKEVSFTWREYLDIMARLEDYEEQIEDLMAENQTLREQLDRGGSYDNV